MHVVFDTLYMKQTSNNLDHQENHKKTQEPLDNPPQVRTLLLVFTKLAIAWL